MNLDIRIAVVAVIVALVAVVAGFALTASDAPVHELPAILTDGFALAFAESTQSAGPGDDEAPLAVCKVGPVSVDCTYY